MSEFVKGRI
uniref:Uncharacterized protein n=1 Tax=Anguilla anguilla TaxID=7936 RepID=A0A0E9S393_ANGAN